MTLFKSAVMLVVRNRLVSFKHVGLGNQYWQRIEAMLLIFYAASRYEYQGVTPSTPGQCPPL